jgi:hypothetical protein
MIRTLVSLLLLSAALAASLGCAQRSVPAPVLAPPASAPASAEAEAIYSYLAYRELMQEAKETWRRRRWSRPFNCSQRPNSTLNSATCTGAPPDFSDALLVLNQGLSRYPESEALLSALAKPMPRGAVSTTRCSFWTTTAKTPERIELATKRPCTASSKKSSAKPWTG